MTAPSARPERSDARQNRERIVEAARDLFLEHGTTVEMRHIAEHAGVGVGTIYRNFPAKSDLVFAVAADLIDEADRALDRVLALEDPIQAVRAYVETLAETFSKTAPLAMDLISAGEFESISRRVLHWLVEPRLEVIIQRGIRTGVFRPDLDVPVARLFVASAADPLLVKCVGPGPFPPAIRNGLVELVLRALLAPGLPFPAGRAKKGT